MMEELAGRLKELSVFADLKEDPVVNAMFVTVETAAEGSEKALRQACARFAALLYAQNTTDWTGYLCEAIFTLPTCVAFFAGSEHEIPKMMLDAAMSELALLSQVGSLCKEDFCPEASLARWSAQQEDLQALYLHRLMAISKTGVGLFAKAAMFRVHTGQKEPELIPIRHADPIRLAQLYDYDRQHQEVLDNTKALLNNKPAANILLYGDAGTGKSATVKAVVNELAPEGLRLIEVRKDQLEDLPALLDLLALQPLKFILFIDDLSFMENDDGFSALKAVLEGSAAARSDNTVIYATSNRRHLVKESLSARQGDDVHRSDTLQETISLSERFGLKILFAKPTMEEYLAIVHAMAQEAELDMDLEDLDCLAEQYALKKSGRSARAARQLIEWLSAQPEQKE